MLGSGLNTTCLEVPGQRSTLSTQQCGNGILEPGEECDPGQDGSNCCTSDCKLTDGSACDPSNQGCCTDSCQFSSSGVVCRPSVNEDCDPAETCTGDSGDCPADKHADNGKSCGDGLQCAAGRVSSHFSDVVAEPTLIEFSNVKCTSKDSECKEKGSSLGITKACSQSSSTCEMTCDNPSGSGCVILGSYFSDGLPCGLAGTCNNGSCDEGSLSARISSWISQNKQYSIRAQIVILHALEHIADHNWILSYHRCWIHHRAPHSVEPPSLLLLPQRESPHGTQRRFCNPQPPVTSVPGLPACATAESPFHAATVLFASHNASAGLPTSSICASPLLRVLCPTTRSTAA